MNRPNKTWENVGENESLIQHLRPQQFQSFSWLAQTLASTSLSESCLKHVKNKSKFNQKPSQVHYNF